MPRLNLVKELNLNEGTEARPELATLCLRDAEMTEPSKALLSFSVQDKSHTDSPGTCYEDSNELGPEKTL